MSFELLNAAARSPAFDPNPPPVSLAEAHVPYTVLTSQSIEEDVRNDLVNYGRVALVAPIGAGKSSLARYILKPNGHHLAPIWINVATEDHDRIATVRGFLEVLATQLVGKATRTKRLAPAKRQELLRKVQRSEPLGSDEERLESTLGGSLWLLKSELASEMSRAFDYGSAYRDTEALRDGTRDALAILKDHDLIPVLIADDTDRLLRVGSSPEISEQLFQGFFGEVLRELTDQLDCALLVAAHDRYAERDDYQEMTAGRLRSIPLPVLDQGRHFGALITARLEFIDEAASSGDIVESAVLDRLAELHTSIHRRSVRRTLTVLKQGLALAAGEGCDLCAVRHIEAAAAG